MRYTFLLLFAFSSLIAPGAVGQVAPMQRGIRVQLAQTDHASPFAEADEAGEWIVAIPGDGGIYLGTKAVTADGLYYLMKSRSHKIPKQLFIKADERAAYGTVEQLLENIHKFFKSVTLLTAQTGVSASDSRVMPQGFEVLVGSAEGESRLYIQVNPGDAVRVNDQAVPSELLEQTLRNLMTDNKDAIIPVQAKEQVPFAQVAHVIDVCTAVGARVSLTLPSQ